MGNKLAQSYNEISRGSESEKKLGKKSNVERCRGKGDPQSERLWGFRRVSFPSLFLVGGSSKAVTVALKRYVFLMLKEV